MPDRIQTQLSDQFVGFSLTNGSSWRTKANGWQDSKPYGRRQYDGDRVVFAPGLRSRHLRSSRWTRLNLLCVILAALQRVWKVNHDFWHITVCISTQQSLCIQSSSVFKVLIALDPEHRPSLSNGWVLRALPIPLRKYPSSLHFAIRAGSWK